jgi:integrase
MTFIFKRKSGIYYYRKTYVLPSGRRRQIRSSLKTTDRVLAQYLALRLFLNIAPDVEANGVASAEQSQERSGAITQPRPAKLLLRIAIDLYLAEKARAGYWTSKEYRRGEVMLEALAKVLGRLDVAAITRREANLFKESLLETTKSITTVNNYLKRAAMLWDWLVHRGDCSDNVFRGQGVKQRRLVSALRGAYTADEKISYLQFARFQEEWRKWILLLLRYTGARPSEICQLYRADIDLDTGGIEIQAARPDQGLKTLSSARRIPIHSQLLKAGFADFVRESQHPRLFPQLNRVKSGGFSHTFVTWYAKVRIRAKGKGVEMPGLYEARHTAATEMKSAGIPLQFAAAVLGHSTNSITYDRYGKGVEMDALREAVEAIGCEPLNENNIVKQSKE